MGGQLSAPSSSLPRKELLEPRRQEARCVVDLIWTSQWREEFLLLQELESRALPSLWPSHWSIWATKFIWISFEMKGWGNLKMLKNQNTGYIYCVCEVRGLSLITICINVAFDPTWRYRMFETYNRFNIFTIKVWFCWFSVLPKR